MPATSREVGTVARVTVEVPWSFPSTEGFKSSVSSVGASDVLGKEYREREAKLVVFVMETEKALYFKKLNEAISMYFLPFLQITVSHLSCWIQLKIHFINRLNLSK